jgi:arylsulfatase A-like enzyme
MKRRDFLKTAGMSVAAFTLAGCEFPRWAVQGRPNIIVITSDDMGYADIGCHGCKDIATPNIDSIAQKGVRFTNGYVSAPECSPSRAGLMTGRYQQRFGYEYNPGPEPHGIQDHVGLPLHEITLANITASAGYVTGAVGKWHLGTAPHFHPLKRGFDEFFGYPHGGHPYFGKHWMKSNPLMRGTTPVDEKEHLTDAFTREAVAFIERHRNEPFFLYLAYHAPHKPIQVPQRYQNSFEHITKPVRRAYAGLIAAMDDGIGNVLGQLRTYGIEENTLVFFLNDNGGAKMCGASNSPLKAGKSSLFEGGIRVPFMVQWPQMLTGGATYDHPVISLDILPTVAAVAGAKLPQDRKIDGVNLIPYLTGQNKKTPHEILFWRRGETYAIRNEDWKFVKKNDKIELFNLASDIAETQDLTTEHSDLVEHLTKAYEKWNAQMPAPLWPNQITKPKPEEDYKNVTHQDTGYYIQSGKTYTMTIKAKSLVGTGNRITLYCWCGFWDIRKTLITSADFSLTSSMEAKSISFDSDNYAGRLLIFGYKVTGKSPGKKVVVDNNISLSYTDKQPDTDPPRPETKRLE